MSGHWSYEGRRVVIAGCCTGMGAATAAELVALGAEVHGVDVREPSLELASFRVCDLGDRQSIDDAVGGIGGEVDAVFNCAGIPAQGHTGVDVMKVNFIGLRHWTERFVERMPSGGAIASISSTVGFQYMQKLTTLAGLLETTSFDDAVAWCTANPDVVADGYATSKEALIIWTMAQARPLIERGIRINCISPAPTSTPMMDAFESAIAPAAIDVFTLPIGRRSTPAEQARPLVFLNSDAAGYVNGHNLNVDGGFTASVVTGTLDLAKELQAVFNPS